MWTHVRAGDVARPDLGTGGMASKLAVGPPGLDGGRPGAARRRRRRRRGRSARPTSAPPSRRAAARLTAAPLLARPTPPTPKGTLHLDDGAVAAVVGRRRSLLAAGITG